MKYISDESNRVFINKNTTFIDLVSKPEKIYRLEKEGIVKIVSREALCHNGCSKFRVETDASLVPELRTIECGIYYFILEKVINPWDFRMKELEIYHLETIIKGICKSSIGINVASIKKEIINGDMIFYPMCGDEYIYGCREELSLIKNNVTEYMGYGYISDNPLTWVVLETVSIPDILFKDNMILYNYKSLKEYYTEETVLREKVDSVRSMISKYVNEGYIGFYMSILFSNKISLMKEICTAWNIENEMFNYQDVEDQGIIIKCEDKEWFLNTYRRILMNLVPLCRVKFYGEPPDLNKLEALLKSNIYLRDHVGLIQIHSDNTITFPSWSYKEYDMILEEIFPGSNINVEEEKNEIDLVEDLRIYEYDNSFWIDILDGRTFLLMTLDTSITKEQSKVLVVKLRELWNDRMLASDWGLYLHNSFNIVSVLYTLPPLRYMNYDLAIEGLESI